VRKGKGGLGDLGDVDVVVERPVGGAVVILAAVIVQARHGSPRSRCSSSNAAPRSRVLLRFALALSPSFRSGVWTLSDFHPVLVGGYIGRKGLESLACRGCPFGVVGSGDWRGV